MSKEKKIKLYGTSWCGDCVRVRFFLMTNNVDFEYIDIDQDDEASDYVISINPQKNRSIPVLVYKESVLIEPTLKQLGDLFLDKLK